MSPGERAAMLDVLRTFKRPEDSEMDAALNMIASHAEKIRKALTLSPDERAALVRLLEWGVTYYPGCPDDLDIVHLCALLARLRT